MSSIWERINQQQVADIGKARQAIILKQHAQEATRRQAEEQRIRTQQLLQESGALKALTDIKEGLPEDPRNNLIVGTSNEATFRFGVSASHCSEIEVRIDDQRDEIVVMKGGIPNWRGESFKSIEQRISREQWERDPSVVETAIAEAYLHPTRSVAHSRSTTTSFSDNIDWYDTVKDIQER